MPAAIAWGGAAGALVVTWLLLRGAYRYASSPRRTERGRRTTGGIGTAATLLAVVVGSGAAGSVFASRPPGAGYPRAGGAVLAGCVLVFFVGLALRRGAARTRDVGGKVVRGRGLVVAATKLPGLSIHGVPVWRIEMEVTAPETTPFRSVRNEEIPDRLAATVHVGAVFPVYVDPETQSVSVPWIRALPRPGDGLADDHVATPRVFQPRPLPGSLATTAGSRTAMLIVIMVLLAAAGSFASSLLGSDDAPPIVVGEDPVPPATGPRIGVSIPPIALSFALPAGWHEEAAADPGPDLVSHLTVGSGESTLAVARSRALERVLAQPGGSAVGVFGAVENELAGSIVDTRVAEVGTEAAVVFDLRPGRAARVRRLVVVRRGVVLLVTLKAPHEDWDDVAADFDAIVASWAWTLASP